MLLYQILAKNNEFRISQSTQNKKFELPDGPCSVLNNQDYFEYINKDP